jgi:hypothetical protein
MSEYELEKDFKSVVIKDDPTSFSTHLMDLPDHFMISIFKKFNVKERLKCTQ